MKSNQVNLLVLLVLFTLGMVSCDNDALSTAEDPVDFGQVNQGNNGNDGRPGNGGGNGNQNTPPNDDVSELDNYVAQTWIELFLELERYAAGMRPNASARAIAYINLASYETAAPGMRDFMSTSRQIPGLQIQRDVDFRNVDFQLALNSCYADVIEHFLTNVANDYESQIAVKEESLAATLSTDLSNLEIATSITWGESVADQIIAYAQTDANAENQITDPQPTSYIPPTGEGYWTFSAEPERALFPYWGNVRTFVVSTRQTTSLAPIAYSENASSPYYQEMQEAYEANNEAKELDGEQLWIAEFWSDDVENITFSPPARQVSIAKQLIAQQSMNLADALHLYLKLGFSLNDAAVSTWKYKYEHMVMRPSVYIQELIDPSFQTNLYRLIPWPNPTFPGYPSGHSCFASAAAGVFIDFFGNATNFTDRSHEGRTEFRGNPRMFNSFRAMADENGYSRIPLGVHIRMDCKEGLRLGYQISDRINRFDVKRPNS